MPWHWRNQKLRLRDRFRFRWKCDENSVSARARCWNGRRKATPWLSARPAGIRRKTFIERSSRAETLLRRRWKSSIKACGAIRRKNMRAVDTNVLVRLVTRDDRKQVAAAE